MESQNIAYETLRMRLKASAEAPKLSSEDEAK